MLYPQGTDGSPRLQRSQGKKAAKGNKGGLSPTVTMDVPLKVEFEVTEFAPETFKLLMEYAHTGAVLLQVGGERDEEGVAAEEEAMLFPARCCCRSWPIVAFLQVDTLMGLLNAADHFRFDHLKASCADYLSRCIAIDTVWLPLSGVGGRWRRGSFCQRRLNAQPRRSLRSSTRPFPIARRSFRCCSRPGTTFSTKVQRL